MRPAVRVSCPLPGILNLIPSYIPFERIVIPGKGYEYIMDLACRYSTRVIHVDIYPGRPDHVCIWYSDGLYVLYFIILDDPNEVAAAICEQIENHEGVYWVFQNRVTLLAFPRFCEDLARLIVEQTQ